jgi:hypothetical protein
MIAVRCPACGKVVGFDQSDGGALVACPHCRQPFFIPAVARPVASVEAPSQPPQTAPTEPPEAPSLPREPSLPDEIAVAPDPDLDPVLQPPCDEVVVVEEPPPSTAITESPPLESSFTSDPIPVLELDSPPEPDQPRELIGTPAEVRPTDLAPSLAAAAALSEALPPRPKEPDRPIDVLEEVEDEPKEDRHRPESEEDAGPPEGFDRVPEKEDEKDRRKRRRRKKERDYGTPYHEQQSRGDAQLTRNRIMGGVGALLGGFILLGTLAHHLTASASAWHYGVCCADLFALAMVGAGVYYMIRG